MKNTGDTSGRSEGSIDGAESATDLFPMYPHCSLILGQTGCGKTKLILDRLATIYSRFFEDIILFCPTIKYNKTYLHRSFVWEDDHFYLVDPGNSLNDSLESANNLLARPHDSLRSLPSPGNILFIIDDCAAHKDI